MSEDNSQKVTEVGPGPSAIRFREPGGSFELMGYLLVTFDDEKKFYNSHFVMRAGVKPPLPLDKIDSELSFTRIKAPEESPEEFYKWAVENGEFGDKVDTYRAEETYYDWKV
ncbi:MAG: hypothetical protein ACLFVJ_22520 [Persicimonas sp.]